MQEYQAAASVQILWMGPAQMSISDSAGLCCARSHGLKDVGISPRNPRKEARTERPMLECRYDLLRVVGEGAFGTAYLVKRKNTVCLSEGKVTEPLLFVAKKTSISHLRRGEQNDAICEAELLRSLSHPNIVEFVDSFVEEQRGAHFLYIIMGFADAGDLAARIQRAQDLGKAIPEHEAVLLLVQARGSGL